MSQVCSLAPRSAFDWGVYAVAAAFLLLGVGAVVSLLKRPRRGE